MSVTIKFSFFLALYFVTIIIFNVYELMGNDIDSPFFAMLFGFFAFPILIIASFLSFILGINVGIVVIALCVIALVMICVDYFYAPSFGTKPPVSTQ